MARVAVRRHIISAPRLPDNFEGLRLIHLSDLHLRCWNGALAQARDHLKRLLPHVVVVTGDLGDLHTAPSRSAALLRRFLQGITPEFGCLVSLGNHDDPRLGGLLAEHVTVLADGHVRLARGDSVIAMAGLRGQCRGAWDIPATLLGIAADCFTVLLSHFPQVVYTLPRRRVDLLLAGDTHGGQFRLPAIGPLCPFFSGLPRGYAWGLQRMGDQVFHVSAGLGCARLIPFRLGCPPEVTLLTLTRRGAGGRDPRH